MIVFQSYTAVANQKITHQVDVQHIQTEHSHLTDDSLATNDGENDHNVQDCHHCGHCHGSHTHWFSSKNLPQTLPLLLVFNHYLYQNDHEGRFVENLIRPPIA